MVCSRGSFRNDEFDGDGVLTYSDGSVYRGEFKDGQVRFIKIGNKDTCNG